MTSTEETTPTTRRLIIHHLSDLHFKHGSDSSKLDLVTYSGYLAKQPKERQPDLVVLTGDLTAEGNKVDLDLVANGLKIAFPDWDRKYHEHIYVVPGPHDVNWEGDGNAGLSVFYESFKDFALPPLEGAPGRPTPEIIVSDAPDPEKTAFVGYPLDTCYSPDELEEELQPEFDDYARKFKEFVKRRGAAPKRRGILWGLLPNFRHDTSEKARIDALKDLNQRYLDLTEGALPATLDAGRVTKKDFDSFISWKEAFEEQAQPKEQTDARKDPLKILITHHALAVEADEDGAQDEAADSRQETISSFQQLTNEARLAGFHLALHGHIHKPQILSDLSVLAGADPLHPMRQIGAASFDDTGLFNEITARYREEKGQGIWRLELRLVDVRKGEESKSSYVLLNPAESADVKVEALTKAQEVRAEFDQRMRTAMRSFSEQIYRAPEEDRTERAKPELLSEAMRPFESMIRDIIFAGLTTRTRLILKNIEPYGYPSTLTDKYLKSAEIGDTDPLLYPASLAAWSLVLGRTLCYPDMMSLDTTSEDLKWLILSEKIPRLLDELQWIKKEDMARSSPRHDASNRFVTLTEILQAIQANKNAILAYPKAPAGDPKAPAGNSKAAEGDPKAAEGDPKATEGDSKAAEGDPKAAKGDPKAAKAIETVIAGKEMYQEPLVASTQAEYPYFICVPYPMRSLAGGASPLPEIAVLEVGVREVKLPDSVQSSTGTATNEKFNPFTDERIEMLECLMELVGLTLTTANALGKPEGKWDNRPRAKAEP